MLLSTADTDELERAMTALFDRFGGMGIAELQTHRPARARGASPAQFGETIRALPFQLPENFLLLIRTISLISGVTSALDTRLQHVGCRRPVRAHRPVVGRRGALRELPQKALAYRDDDRRASPAASTSSSTRIDRGQVAVRTPDVDRRLRSLERAIGRLDLGDRLRRRCSSRECCCARRTRCSAGC